MGYTRFLFDKKKIDKEIITTIALLKYSVSDNTPTGKINILAIKAANVEYARQLNHLKIFEFSLIFSELNTPTNLDRYVARDVTIIINTTLFDIKFPN